MSKLEYENVAKTLHNIIDSCSDVETLLTMMQSETNNLLYEYKKQTETTDEHIAKRLISEEYKEFSDFEVLSCENNEHDGYQFYSELIIQTKCCELTILLLTGDRDKITINGSDEETYLVFDIFGYNDKAIQKDVRDLFGDSDKEYRFIHWLIETLGNCVINISK